MTDDKNRPTTVPMVRDERIKEYCSYINILTPCAFVRPMALRQPYSQRLSLIFCVVETKSKKNARVNAIVPTKATNI